MGLDLLVRASDGEGEAYIDRIAGYDRFHEFRNAWATLLGFDLERMDGYGGTQEWSTQPLRCFFDHSDCEGEISWQDAAAILEQADMDASKLPEFADEFRVLKSACQAAIAEQMPIVFC